LPEVLITWGWENYAIFDRNCCISQKRYHGSLNGKS